MDLRQIEYVVGVIDHGTFTAAAAELHVSQPSLSQGIARLETELGITLFHRLARGVRPTTAGVAFVGPARQILRDVAVLEESVRAVAGLESGTLDLVALPTLAADPLAAIVGAFRRAHPGVVVHVTEPESADAVAERVRDGRAELGLAELPVRGGDLAGDALGDQELVVILPPGDVPDVSRIEDLADLPLVTSPIGTSTRRLVEEAFAAANLEPRIAVETEQREAILPLVIAGAGIAFVPAGLARTAAEQGAAVTHLDPPLRRSIGLIYRVAQLSPAAQRFRDLAAQVTAAQR
jgi:LysR family transcriptional regulator, carnitine catabolism transcriptional activator